jgi:hypothetical protein
MWTTVRTTIAARKRRRPTAPLLVTAVRPELTETQCPGTVVPALSPSIGTVDASPARQQVQSGESREFEVIGADAHRSPTVSAAADRI